MSEITKDTVSEDMKSLNYKEFYKKYCFECEEDEGGDCERCERYGSCCLRCDHRKTCERACESEKLRQQWDDKPVGELAEELSEREESLLTYIAANRLRVLAAENEKLLSERKQITEIIARNCIAWDTSKDKREGLLPEVVIFNHALYKQLTGEEYNFSKACKKFYIGDDWS